MMNKLKSKIILAFLLGIIIIVAPNSTHAFSDVNKNDYYYNSVKYLTENQIIRGYGDGTYGPYRNVTREQASNIVWNTVDRLGISHKKVRGAKEFEDVRFGDNKYYINMMYSTKIISGYDNDTFRPNNHLTRAQASKIIASAFKLDTLPSKKSKKFSDVRKKDWFYDSVMLMSEHGITTGTGNGKFNPNGKVTRGQLAVFVDRAIKEYSKHNNINKMKKKGDSFPNTKKMLLSGLNKHDKRIKFDTNEVHYNDVRHIIHEIRNKSHDRYFIDNWITYASGSVEINYYDSLKERQRQEKAVKNKVNEIIRKNTSKNQSDYEKVKAIYDYITYHSEYDFDNYEKGEIPLESYNAYGVLVKEIGVCDSYAKAMQLLLDELGIENRYIVGNAGGYHSWNLVKLDGNWYHLDATWDGGSYGRTSYRYFLKSDKSMSESRNWEVANYPKATKDY